MTFWNNSSYIFMDNSFQVHKAKKDNLYLHLATILSGFVRFSLVNLNKSFDFIITDFVGYSIISFHLIRS